MGGKLSSQASRDAMVESILGGKKVGTALSQHLEGERITPREPIPLDPKTVAGVERVIRKGFQHWEEET